MSAQASGGFANEPTLELRRREVREELLAGLDALERTLPISVPMLIGAPPLPMRSPGIPSAPG